MTKYQKVSQYAAGALLCVFLLGIPTPVHAGSVKNFFSFLSNVFASQSADIPLEASVYNSQTVPLPRAALNIDPNPSQGGAEIIIVDNEALLSEEGPSGTQVDINDETTSDQISIYVVREGDSLSQIAKMFNVSVGTIIWANDIRRGSLIRPGETLIILPISGVRHIVKSGDTLKTIVKKYDGNIEEVLQYNDLTESTTLSVGDVVVVPGGEMAIPVYSSRNTIVKGTGGPTYSGYYLRPVNGRRSQGLHGYNAVDIAAHQGTPVVAAASGVVIINRSYGWNGGYGKYIVIKHNNGTQTLYAHNSQNIVFQGQYVVQGQVIGYVGSTGRSTGAHVHFEVRGAKNPF